MSNNIDKNNVDGDDVINISEEIEGYFNPIEKIATN